MVSDRLRYAYAERALPHLSAGEQISLATQAHVTPLAASASVSGAASAIATPGGPAGGAAGDPFAPPAAAPAAERMRLILTERRLLFFRDVDEATPPTYVVMVDGTPVTAIEYQGAQRSFTVGAAGSPHSLGLVFKRATREDAAPIHAAFRSAAPTVAVKAGVAGAGAAVGGAAVAGGPVGAAVGGGAPPAGGPVAGGPAGGDPVVLPGAGGANGAPRGAGGSLDARAITAWFGDRKVLDRVSLTMPAGVVTALIGPSGCGKSTFLRILNRMHELVPKATLAGEVLLDGEDVYAPGRRLIEARASIGMVFQKPNPFPAMSVYENVVAGLALTGRRASRDEKDALVEECLTKAGLWTEVRDRLRQPGGALSGGQQQRLCIARSLAIRPRVLLMDEPCSALDPTSTRRIEETIGELAHEVTIVIVTHNMQQAARVSQQCAFFLAAQGTPGRIIEYGPTEAMFGAPSDQRTSDYVNGRFG